MNGQIEAVCEAVFSEMESQAVDALDLPMSPGSCFRMRSHSYVRAIEKGCSQVRPPTIRKTLIATQIIAINNLIVFWSLTSTFLFGS